VGLECCPKSNPSRVLVPFDVIVISTEWFEDRKNVIGGIAYPANKYGKVIYEAA
jgi:hypothetical protein